MQTKIKRNKEIDKLIEAEYYKQGQGVQVSVMDISKIYADCYAALGDLSDWRSGVDIIARAMTEAIKKYGIKA